jgi:uncharacterized delta-60 repeat protein
VKTALAAMTAAVTLTGTAPGELDHSFGVAGEVITNLGSEHDTAAAVAVRRDGRIVVAGSSGDAIAVVRYLSRGVLDQAFGDHGVARTRGAHGAALALQRDGRVLVAGRTLGADHDAELVRYTADGKPDPSFGRNGVVVTDLGAKDDAPAGLAVRPDGRIVLAGSSGGAIVLAGYTAEGKPDPGFGKDGLVRTTAGAAARAAAITPRPDGGFMVAGSTDEKSSGTSFLTAAYDSAGRPDRAFGTNGLVVTDFGTLDDRAQAVAVQPDGKVVAAGTSGGALAVARYDATGRPDAGFSRDGRTVTPAGTAARGVGVALAPDGRIVVAGQTDAPETGTSFVLARYLPDGSPDTDFQGGAAIADFGSPHDRAAAVALQPDAKAVVAGTTDDPVVGEDFAVARFLP